MGTAESDVSEATKFLFTVTLQQCHIKAQEGWTPSDLQVTWKRGERRKSFNKFKDSEVILKNEGEDISVDFDDGSIRHMLVTLNKDIDGFKSKEYVFILEEVNGPIFKGLALFSFNIAEYVSMNYESFPLSMKFKPLSEKVFAVSLEAQIRCEFLKKGLYRDSDMMSNFSHLSDSDDSELYNGEVNEDVAMLQSRAYKSRSQLCNDLEQKKYESSAQYRKIMSFGAVPLVKEEIQKGLSALGLHSNKRKVKYDRNSCHVHEIIHQVKDDDFVVNKNLQIQKLQLENEALHVKNAHLLSLIETYREDIHDLQSDVSELHILVKDLRLKLKQSGEDKVSSLPSEKEQLKGWLCKQGVKGGPLGRRMKRRWFCLEDNFLYYYKYPGREQPQGFIDIERIIGVEDLSDGIQDKNNGSFNVLTDNRTYHLSSHDAEDKKRWINMLDQLCTSTPRRKFNKKTDESVSR